MSFKGIFFLMLCASLYGMEEKKIQELDNTTVESTHEMQRKLFIPIISYAHICPTTQSSWKGMKCHQYKIITPIEVLFDEKVCIQDLKKICVKNFKLADITKLQLKHAVEDLSLVESLNDDTLLTKVYTQGSDLEHSALFLLTTKGLFAEIETD